MPTVHREDGTVLSLTDRDFVASGGQGAVYVVGDIAHKVVFNSDHALSAARRDALATLQHAAIVRPAALLFHPDGRPAGHTMAAVEGTPWLALVTTASWRTRGMTAPGAVQLCRALAEAVSAAHHCGAVIGDLNPLNLLVRPDLRRLWLIDVDSWGIAGWPATAVLPAVADPRMGAAPTQATDWWGVAVNCFQLITGLHPFRGRHPRVKGIADRARAGLWALDPAVQTPPATRALAGLEPSWRDWLAAVLAGSHRGPPPAHAAWTAAPAPPAAPGPPAAAGGALRVHCRFTAPHALRGLVPVGAGLVAWTAQSVFWNTTRLGPRPQGLCTVVPLGDALVGVGLHDGQVVLDELGEQSAPLALGLQARAVGRMAEAAVVLAGDGLYSLRLVRVGRRLHASLERLGNAHPRTSVLHDGVMVSILAGASWLALSPGPGALVNLRVPALDGSQVVAAVARGRVVVALVARSGRVDRLVLRFGRAWDHHDVSWTEDVGTHSLALARLPSGVVVHTDETDGLVLLPEGPGLTGHRRVATEGRAFWGLAAAGGALVALGEREVVELRLR